MPKVSAKKSARPVSVKAPAASETAVAVGRRKSAAARVRLSLGKGDVAINGKPLEIYFPEYEQRELVVAPLGAVAKEKNFDVSVKVKGGGKRGQAVAVQLGIARALLKWDEQLRKTLKTNGYLTRDPRVKERKKFGLKKARRAPQWAKR
ncbi:30S ribosomal protein S9 [Patescibacteria group bacterium]|nr:MAG: 30S ribosomal protein S9 [Patescibacteria group bacterium]